MDYLEFIFRAINNLLTQNLGFFDAMGQNLFRAFATILLVWYAVKSALSSASGKHLFEFDSFAALLLTISFGFGMANYYSNPIPGIGTSFHNLVTDEAQFLANKINAANVLTLRTVQDSNKLLASLVEQQTILSKQQRDATANAINAEIARRANLAGNMARLTSTLTDSLENFRMP